MDEVPAWSLRRVVESDREILRTLHRRTMREYVEQVWGWDGDWQDRYFDESFDADREWRIIEIDGAPAGMLDVVERGDDIYLASIQLLPEWQRRGIGAAVIRRVLAEAGGAGKPVVLQVLKVNERARRLYEREGFEVVEETETHVRMRADPRSALST